MICLNTILTFYHIAKISDLFLIASKQSFKMAICLFCDVNHFDCFLEIIEIYLQ